MGVTRSPTKPKVPASSQLEVQVKCSVCSILQSECDKTWISCNLCLMWWHSDCAGLSSSQFRELDSDDESIWFCDLCSIKINKNSATQIDSSQSLRSNELDFIIDKISVNLNLNLDAKFMNLESRVTDTLTEFKQQLTDDFALKQTKIEDDLIVMKDEINSLKTKVDKKIQITGNSDNHLKAVNQMEQKIRECNVLLNGIPKTVDIFKFDFLTSIANEIGMVLNIGDILSTSRVSVRAAVNGARPPSVIVTFVRKCVRNEFFSKYLMYTKNQVLTLKVIDGNLQTSRIYISDHLTKVGTDLYYKTRTLKKEKKIYNTFTRNGIVFVIGKENDNPFPIFSAADLDQIG